MQQVQHAGIDVSAKTLDVVVAGRGPALQQGCFANTPQGHRAVLKWLTQGVHTGGLRGDRLVMAMALHGHRRVEVMVINPKAIKHYAHACRPIR